MPGPPKIPTAILKAQGSPLVKKRGNEPVGSLIIIECPEWLNDQARSFYEDLCVILKHMRVLTAGDCMALSRYCETLADWKEAREFLNKNGKTYDVYYYHPKFDDDGKEIVKETKPYPQVYMLAKWGDQLMKFEREFGLTPSARVSVSAIPGSAPDPKHAKFYAKRNPDNAIQDQQKEA